MSRSSSRTEFRDPRSRVPICDEESAIGQPVNVGRPVEVCGIRPGYFRRSDRLEQFAPIVCELIDDLHIVIHDPDILLRIVWADIDRMRAAKQLIPLLPGLDDFAGAIHNHHAVFPFRVDSELAIGLSPAP
jgi:hypothetical protein